MEGATGEVLGTGRVAVVDAGTGAAPLHAGRPWIDEVDLVDVYDLPDADLSNHAGLVVEGMVDQELPPPPPPGGPELPRRVPALAVGLASGALLPDGLTVALSRPGAPVSSSVTNR